MKGECIAMDGRTMAQSTSILNKAKGQITPPIQQIDKQKHSHSIYCHCWRESDPNESVLFFIHNLQLFV